MMRLFTSSLLAIFFIGTTMIFAQPQKNFKRGSKDFNGFRVQTMLKLTDEQSEKFNDIKYNHQISVVDIQAEIQKNQIEVKKMMADNKIDSDKLLQLTNANSELHGKIKASKTQMWIDVYNILNDDQKETWTKTFNRLGRREGTRGIGFGHGIMKGDCKPGSGAIDFRGYNQQ